MLCYNYGNQAEDKPVTDNLNYGTDFSQAKTQEYKPASRGRSCLGCLVQLLLLLLLFVCLLTPVLVLSPISNRVNVLIIGVDERPGETGASRTDTIILGAFALYPSRAAFLTIPRDLWVAIPGQSENRINTAFFFGEAKKRGTGQDLAMSTIETNFGVPIHKYIRLNFEGFKKIIDAAGGIDVMVKRTIKDNEYPTDDGRTQTLVIQSGLQHFDGEMALKYVRTRHADSDFGRGVRQEQVIVALVTRMLNPLQWYRWPLVAVAFLDSAETNLTPGDMFVILVTMARSQGEGLKLYQISQEMTSSYTTDGGANVLLPDWEKIRPMISELFY
jgi:polyisoprenyl-teichoic acid--peptidoglycan teichoic acid transferase